MDKFRLSFNSWSFYSLGWLLIIPLLIISWNWTPLTGVVSQQMNGNGQMPSAALTESDRGLAARPVSMMQPVVMLAGDKQTGEAGRPPQQNAVMLNAIQSQGSQNQAAPPPERPAEESGPAGASAQPPQAQPVAHARNASVRSCLPALQELSQMVVDGQHVAMSTWNNVSANDRLFQSIIGLKYDNKTAPHGLSVLVAAPMQAERCDGATVQIQPSALPCDKIAKNLAGAQLGAADLNGMRMIEASKSTRVVLLPTRGNGCAVVGIGVHYAK